ncbi:MAG: FmdB family zinc ribbon protein [Thermodesulfobacteriota bacterium]
MPIYEYQCAACGQVTEKWQKFSEAPLTVCPHCGGSLEKLISSCAFHLKGGGWYVSDYGGKNPANGAVEPTKEAADSAPAKESSTTEATPSRKIK